jgi:hypothetical protein
VLKAWPQLLMLLRGADAIEGTIFIDGLTTDKFIVEWPIRRRGLGSGSGSLWLYL